AGRVPAPHRGGGAERLPVAHAGQDLRRVLLDFHATAAAVAALAASQVRIDVALGDQLEPGRHALHEGDQSAAMGFPRGSKREMHRVSWPAEPPYAAPAAGSEVKRESPAGAGLSVLQA